MRTFYRQDKVARPAIDSSEARQKRMKSRKIDISESQLARWYGGVHIDFAAPQLSHEDKVFLCYSKYTPVGTVWNSN